VYLQRPGKNSTVKQITQLIEDIGECRKTFVNDICIRVHI
jgi:hypothetical protein